MARARPPPDERRQQFDDGALHPDSHVRHWNGEERPLANHTNATDHCQHRARPDSRPIHIRDDRHRCRTHRVERLCERLEEPAPELVLP